MHSMLDYGWSPLGLAIQFAAGKAKPDRMWKLRGALLGMVAQRRATSLAIQMLCGHLIFGFTVCRPMLAVPDASFVFAFAGFTTPQTLPMAVLMEFTVCAALLPFLVQHVGDNISTTVYCSDSSLRGYAVHAAPVSHSVLRTEAFLSERWRFKTTRPGPAADVVFRSADALAVATAFQKWAADSLTPTERLALDQLGFRRDCPGALLEHSRASATDPLGALAGVRTEPTRAADVQCRPACQ